MSAHLASDYNLSVLASTLRKARDGGSPLLTKLRLTGSFGGSVSWRAVSSLGAWFPELESLEMQDVQDEHYGDDCNPSISMLILRDKDYEVAPMPRLRRLQIGQLCGFTTNVTSAQLSLTLSGLIGACPVLEHLSIKHGMMWSGGSQPKPAQPLPNAGQCFQALPASLETLALTEITLPSNAFEACSFPKLRSLQLRKVGEHGKDIAESLVAACPKLNTDLVKVDVAKLS